MEEVTITKVVKVYSLEEMLSDPERKKNLLEANVIEDELLDLELQDEAQYFEGVLKSKGYNDPKLWWDLSYCQGSGACFDCDNIDIPKILDDSDIEIKNSYKNIIIKLFNEGVISAHTERNFFANHYYHSKTRDVVVEVNSYNLYRIPKLVQKILYKHYQSCCYDLYKRLEKILDTVNSEEYIIENLKSLGYNKFLSSGVIFNDL